MKPIFGNGFVWWDEIEIEVRESLVRELTAQVKAIYREINPAIGLFRVETPCLIPKGLVSDQFQGYSAGPYALRAESTSGTYAVFTALSPRLPVIFYQVNKSFRDEASDAMRVSKLRLREFWQLEYQLFYSLDTKVDYHQRFIERFRIGMADEKYCELTTLPSYSTRTTDIEVAGLEVASFSTRKDFPGYGVFEMSFGLDRLVAVKEGK